MRNQARARLHHAALGLEEVQEHLPDLIAAQLSVFTRHRFPISCFPSFFRLYQIKTFRQRLQERSSRGTILFRLLRT